MIKTTHIQKMLAEARVLAERVERYGDSESQDGSYAAKALERAANLARHAAAELDDERLRARDGWPA